MKEKFKITVLAFVFVCAAFLSGCNKQGSEVDIDQIYSGTQGVNIDFMRNLPPSKIYDIASLDMLLEIQNKGAFNLRPQDCVLHIHGFDPNIIRGLDKRKVCSEQGLLGKSIQYPKGEENVIEFGTDNIELDEGIDSFPQSIVASVCYSYETIANPVVCIDPRYYEPKSVASACSVGGVSLAGGQGAPVSVTNVKTNMIGSDRVSFEIDVRNSGGGYVLRSGIDNFNTCPYNIDYDDYDIVEYTVSMTGGSMISCSPEIEGGPRLRLNDGSGKIICTFNVVEESAYTTPLKIWLGYSYLDSISKSFEIIKTPR